MSTSASQARPLKERLKSLGTTALQSHSRDVFLDELVHGADVFDIGCGNDPFKVQRPDIRYVGLDVKDYNQRHDPTEHADEYIAVPTKEFLIAIEERPNQFDAVVSSHNLEHCENPDGVVSAMARALRPGGRIFLAFPSAASLNMPSREGTLNFWDDDTHLRPPDYRRVLSLLTDEGISIDYAAERYRPLVRFAVGLLLEPISRKRKKVVSGTWALWGFETVIWGTKA